MTPAKGFRRRLLQQSLWSSQTAGEGILWTGVQTPQRQLRKQIEHAPAHALVGRIHCAVKRCVSAAGVAGAAEAAGQADQMYVTDTFPSFQSHVIQNVRN